MTESRKVFCKIIQNKISFDRCRQCLAKVGDANECNFKEEIS